MPCLMAARAPAMATQQTSPLSARGCSGAAASSSSLRAASLPLVAPLRSSSSSSSSSKSRRFSSSSSAVAAAAAAVADRTFFVGGNWKSNCTKASVTQLVKELNEAAKGGLGGLPPADQVEIVVGPEHIHLSMVLDSIDPRYQVSAQNCWTTSGGAYTGEIAAEALVDLGVTWCILGHSERRSLLGESNEFVGKKVEHAIDVGMSVIACVGETLSERESGSMFDVLSHQMAGIADELRNSKQSASKGGVDKLWESVVVAYEPVWAIGTGVVATPEQAQEAHAFLRTWLRDNVGAGVAERTRILYGGSVNDANAATLAQKPDIDGFLVGGASLKGDSFAAICRAPASQVAA